NASRRDPAPTVAGVSAFQASAWRRVIPVDAILPPHIPTRSIRWSPTAGENAVFAGRLSPEKGAAEAIEIALAAGIRIDVYDDRALALAMPPTCAKPPRPGDQSRRPRTGLHACRWGRRGGRDRWLRRGIGWREGWRWSRGPAEGSGPPPRNRSRPRAPTSSWP